MTRPRRLQCACCGETAWGRQWWNRDRGFGLCGKCPMFVLTHGEDEAGLERSYGKRGVHFCTEVVQGLSVGTLVTWATVGGERFQGTLKAWDNGTAIVALMDGGEKAVAA